MWRDVVWNTSDSGMSTGVVSICAVFATLQGYKTGLSSHSQCRKILNYFLCGSFLIIKYCLQVWVTDLIVFKFVQKNVKKFQELNHDTFICKKLRQLQIMTRMHSSRMRTGRSYTVCWSLLPGGGVCSGGVCSQGGGCLLLGGGVCSWGGCLVGGSAPGGCLLGGLVSQHALRQTPPPWTEWQTGVKILHWPQLRCGR